MKNSKTLGLLLTTIFIIAGTLEVTAQSNSNKKTVKKIDTVTFSISGLDCDDDKALIERSLYRTKGVKRVDANHETITVTYKPKKVSRETIQKSIETTGTCEDPNARVYKVAVKTDG